MKKNSISKTIDFELLYERIEFVIDFALKNISQLDMAKEMWSESIGAELTLADKILIETALLILITGRNKSLPKHIVSKVRALGEMINPLIRSPRNKILLMRNPSIAAAFGIGHAALCQIGLEDEEFDLLIKRPFSNGEIYNTERVPYRTMDVLWLHKLLFNCVSVSFEGALTHSIAKGRIHPAYMKTPDVYALTHTLMYLTDFGSYPLDKQLDKNYLSEIITSSISYHLLSDNLDILGELLMSACMIGTYDSLCAQTGWKLLNDIWSQLGFLPCPTFDAAEFRKHIETDASSYTFKHLYHTTYVGGILANMLCYVDTQNSTVNTPAAFDADLINNSIKTIDNIVSHSEEFSTSYFNRSLSSFFAKYNQATIKDGYLDGNDFFVKEVIDKYYSNSGAAKYLQKIISSLSQGEGREMYSLLLDAFLIHSIQDYNMPLLIEVVNHIVDTKGKVTTTLIKAVDFVAAQQLPSGAIGCFFVYKENQHSREAFNITALIAQSMHRLKEHLVTGEKTIYPQGSPKPISINEIKSRTSTKTSTASIAL
jgi:hypothetical protein